MSIPDCEFRLGPSWAYVLLSALLHAGAVVALWGSRLDAGLAMALSTIVLAGLWRDVMTTGLRRAPQAIRRIQIRDGEFMLCCDDGCEPVPARLRSAWILGGAVLLRLSGRPGRRATVVVPADALPGSTFRQLRIAVGAALVAGDPA